MPPTGETRAAALARLRPWVERAHGFSGWSFKGLAQRSLDGPLPWDYWAFVERLATSASRVLDVDTGGGEALAAIAGDVHGRLVATEEWPVKVPIARRRLAPLGVDVIWCRSLDLPFAAGSFDLVANRHGGFDALDVARVLRAGGSLVTQQVGGRNWEELGPYFPRRANSDDPVARWRDAFADAGFEIDWREHVRRVAYPSLGEFVYMLCVTPWTIPDLAVEADLDALLALEAECLGADGFVVTEHRHLLVARKPA